MRRLFAIFLLALLLGVGIVALIENDPGYVLLSLGNYSLESSLWVGLILLSVVAFTLYFVVRLFYRLISGQRTLFSWFEHRHEAQARRNTTRGLISFSEGNWAAARRQVVRGAHKNEAPLLNHLLAAQASHSLGEPDKAREFLDAAAEAEGDAAIAVDLARVDLHLQSGAYEQAFALLKDIRPVAAKYPKALGQLRQACVGLGDWDGLLTLLPELKKHKVLPLAEYEKFEREVHQRRLSNASTGDAASTEILRAAWQQVPTQLKQDSLMVSTYSQQLMAVGAHDVAEKLILKGLKHSWDPALVRQFGLLEGGQVAKRLTQAESWLSSHSEDSELLLCLGRLSARDRLWGKARDYFESSYRIERSPEVCAELGRLLTGLGEPKVAAAYYRDGLLVVEGGLPELPMPDKVVSGQLLTNS